MDRIWIDHWLEHHPPPSAATSAPSCARPQNAPPLSKPTQPTSNATKTTKTTPTAQSERPCARSSRSPARDAAHETELRGRLRRALTDLPPEWLAVVLPTSVRNCGVPGPRAHPVIRFDYACPRRWETLQPTDDPAIRRCDACARPVFRCDDLDTAEARARNGDCIAVDGSLAVQNNEPERLVVGRVHTRTWGERLFGG